eukprot:gene8118-5654_t
MWDLAHYFIVGGHALRPNPTSDEVLLVEPGCVANLGGMRSCGSLEKAWPRRATTTHHWGDNAQSSYADAAPPAPVWRAGGVAGADGLIRASTRLERTQDMHNGHCAWRSVRCARVRTEHHTARPLVLWPPYVRGAGHAEAWRGAATTRGRTPTGKGALEVTGPGSGARSSPRHTSLHTGCMRRESAGGRVEHRAIRQGKGCFQAYWGDNTLYHKDSKSPSMWDLAHYFIVGGHALRPNPTSDEVLLVEPGCVANLGGMRSCGSLEKAWPRSYHHTPLGRQCVISRVVITTMLFESIIICRCCTPAPVWRAGGVAGADGLIRASTRLERTQDMHNGHCAWRSVRCARVRTEHHTARPLVLWPPYVRGAGHAEAWRGAATTRGRTPTGKGALEVTGPRVGCPQQPPATHTHISTHGMHAAGERWRACGTPRDQTGQRLFSGVSMSICDGFTSA